MVFVKGKAFTVLFLKRPDGSYPARDYLDSLEKRMKAQMVHTISVFADTGELRDPRKGHKVQNEKDLLEFKAYQARIFWAYEPSRIVLLISGLRKPKKRDHLNASDITRARLYLAEVRATH